MGCWYKGQKILKENKMNGKLEIWKLGKKQATTTIREQLIYAEFLCFYQKEKETL